MTIPAISVSHDNGVGLIRFLPPNILDMPVREALRQAFLDFADNPDVRSIVVSGSPDLFVKGDVHMLAEKNSHEIQAIGLQRYWQPVIDCPKPVIAALAGLAWGAGCELALMCDMIVADPTAQLAQPESRLGVMPGAGGAQRMIRTLGKQMTSYLLMTGQPIDAERAWQLGLICELAPLHQAEQWAIALGQTLVSQPPRSLTNIKRALATGADLPLAAAAAMDHAEYLLMFGTDDQKEGMAAVIEERQPRFSGR